MPKSGKQLVEGMVRVHRFYGSPSLRRIVIRAGSRTFPGGVCSLGYLAEAKRQAEAMLAAVVNAALKEAGK